ncbi:MAG: ABC transporter ATP-binding protein [Actinobacteria bacterium]|nr:ABC transporter ATP-binding protein [Actinomycetota bacterium]
MEKSRVAVVVEGLIEEFSISEDRALSFKEVISRFRLSRHHKTVRALEDITFSISRQESVGLIGANGSGKSTLLRCIAGILPPTRGNVLVAGSISSLIELGAGFHLELTGRENVLLAGALFGLTRAQLDEKFDAIVDFAEVREEIDQPIRSYSSGMYVRLGFSLAVHVEPNIFLIDEVLAVGDEHFQRKCIRRIGEMNEQGVTIIFVSHDLGLVKKVCRRCILLHEGRLAEDGEPEAVINAYLRLID